MTTHRNAHSHSISTRASSTIFLATAGILVWLYGFSSWSVPRIGSAGALPADQNVPAPTWTCIGACPGGTSNAGVGTHELISFVGAGFTLVAIILFTIACFNKKERTRGAVVGCLLFLLALAGTYAALFQTHNL
jgi:hypothetical protein